MAWWEILIIVLAVALTTPIIISAWFTAFTNLINNIKRNRINKNFSDTLETLSKRISDSAKSLDDIDNEIARTEYLKEIEEIKKEIEEEKRNDNNRN